MNKSSRYVNLSLELHVVSIFWLGLDTSGTFSLYFAQPLYELDQPLVQKWHLKLQSFCKSIFDVRQSISSSSSLYIAFVSSRLAQNSPTKCLFPSGKAMFFWRDPQCFGPLGKFQHNIEISIKKARVSRLLFRFLWLCCKLWLKCIY